MGPSVSTVGPGVLRRAGTAEVEVAVRESGRSSSKPRRGKPEAPETEVNPRVGCRVQQTCRARCGENRRSREERQGRNELGVWQLRAEGRGRFAGTSPGVDASRSCRRRGILWTTPREESRSVRSVPRFGEDPAGARGTARTGARLRRRVEGQGGFAPGSTFKSPDDPPAREAPRRSAPPCGGRQDHGGHAARPTTRNPAGARHEPSACPRSLSGRPRRPRQLHGRPRLPCA
jgi:hypothetical protein